MQDYTEKRVLFTCPPTHPAVTDYGAILTSHIHKQCINRFLSASFPVPSWGLYWIKENCPTVEILDMPVWADLERELKRGVDVLGISFYTYQVPDVIKIVKMAREYGVTEIWGGNYGVFTPGVDVYFDRVINGNGEVQLHKILYGSDLKEIKHPIFIQQWKLSGILGRLINTSGFSWSKSGVLWTIKGCFYKCKFCDSPRFIGKTLNYTSLEELRRVLDVYIKKGILSIAIMDLDFLTHRRFSEEVIELLHERNMRWSCMSRMDQIKGRIGYLKEKGCDFIFVGVESLSKESLAEVNKFDVSRQDFFKELFDELTKYKMGYYLLYMLGFKRDTVESLKSEIDSLVLLKATVYQFQIMTPLPSSDIFEEYKNRIINWNWKDWNCNTLVWEHPNITPKQMHKVLIYARKQTALAKILRGSIRRGSLDDVFKGYPILNKLAHLIGQVFSTA